MAAAVCVAGCLVGFTISSLTSNNTAGSRYPTAGLLVQDGRRDPQTIQYENAYRSRIFIESPYFGPTRSLRLTSIALVYTSQCPVKTDWEHAYDVNDRLNYVQTLSPVQAGGVPRSVIGPPFRIADLLIPSVTTVNGWWAGVEISLQRACTVDIQGFEMSYRSGGRRYHQELIDRINLVPGYR